MVDDGRFARRLTKDELFALKQVRKVEREGQFRTNSARGGKGTYPEISVLFRRKDTSDSQLDGRFVIESFVPIYQDVKTMLPGATPRLTKNNKLEILVSNTVELAVFKSWVTVAGLSVKLYRTVL